MSDVVRIRTARNTVELPWESCQDLQERLRPLAGMASLIEELQAAGTRHTVILAGHWKAPLHSAIGSWRQDIKPEEPPEGIVKLWECLDEDINPSPGPVGA